MDTVDADSGFRDRWYAETLRKKLARPFVHILFGARQTGKSTLKEPSFHAQVLFL
jgi:predicted AAA+ superfamily ATPase